MNLDDSQLRALLRRRADRTSRTDVDRILDDAMRAPRIRLGGALGASAGGLGAMVIAVVAIIALVVFVRPPTTTDDERGGNAGAPASPGASGATPLWTAPPGDPTPRIAASLAALGIRSDTLGCAVAISHGTDLYEHGFGLTDLATRTPITPDTTFAGQGAEQEFSVGSILALAAQGNVGRSLVVQDHGRTLVEQDGSWSLAGSRAVLIVDPDRLVALALACSAPFTEPPLTAAASVLGAWETP